MSALFSVLDVEKTYAVGSAPAPFSLLSPFAPFVRRKPRLLKALNGVRLEIAQGDSIAIVGESGSGKSTLVRLMLGLEPASDGRLLYRQADISQFDAAARRNFSREVAFIYQDARGSMNPRMRVGAILAEPMLLHAICTPAQVDERVAALLTKVGLAADMAARYPSELSGGQVRRVAVARALVATLCRELPPSDAVSLDVPLPHAEAVALAEGLGMRVVFETARMYAGPAPRIELARVYGITTFELG